jgi:hypothetical protein
MDSESMASDLLPSHMRLGFFDCICRIWEGTRESDNQRWILGSGKLDVIALDLESEAVTIDSFIQALSDISFWM